MLLLALRRRRRNRLRSRFSRRLDVSLQPGLAAALELKDTTADIVVPSSNRGLGRPVGAGLG
jgi:hypothetical protein